MPHPGYVSRVVAWTGYGPRHGLVSLTGRKKRRASHRRARRLGYRRARRLGYRLRAAMAHGGVRAFCAVALDAMHATPEERMGFEGMSRGSGVCGRCHCKPSPLGCSW